jgi:hypothetical protein
MAQPHPPYQVTFAVHLYIDASSKVSAKPNPEASSWTEQPGDFPRVFLCAENGMT